MTTKVAKVNMSEQERPELLLDQRMLYDGDEGELVRFGTGSPYQIISGILKSASREMVDLICERGLLVKQGEMVVANWPGDQIKQVREKLG